MALSFFKSRDKQPPEEQFWAWFQKNEDLLFHLERGQERTFAKLNAAMTKVHPDLVFEFGPIENGMREFVISADGLRDAFPSVESLYATAPSLPRWTFVAFRPRHEPMKIGIGDLRVAPEDIEVSIEEDGNKAGLTVYVRGLNESTEHHLSQIAFLMLDHAVGEYDMEMKVGFIEIRPFEEQTHESRHSLLEFPAAFDEFISQHNSRQD